MLGAFLIGSLVVIFLFVMFVFLVYNSLVRLSNSVLNSWSGVEVQLKRRADLIPNLVSVVKGYMRHEKELLESVTKARVAILHAKNNVRQAAAAEKVMESGIDGIFLVAENYPKLKASENFLTLQNELARTEDEVASARRIYNSNVREYNVRVQSFPSNIVALIFGFAERDYFEATEGEKREIEVKF